MFTVAPGTITAPTVKPLTDEQKAKLASQKASLASLQRFAAIVNARRL